jgi:hypothetical protein
VEVEGNEGALDFLGIKAKVGPMLRKNENCASM